MTSQYLGLTGVNPGSEPGDIHPTDAPIAPGDTSIVAASIGVYTKVVPTTVMIASPASTPASTPAVAASAASGTSTSATTSPTSSPAPKTGLSPTATKVVAIVVPIVALLLLIPIIYLLYRSHKMRKEEEKRATQRDSQEAMLDKARDPSYDAKKPYAVQTDPSGGMAELKNNGPPPPRPHRPDSTPKSPRPTNSIGLFNFDFGSPTSPNGQQTPSRFSVARSLPFRRSQASVVNQDPKSPHATTSPVRDPLRNNPTANPTANPPANPPPAYSGPTGSPITPPESHFAPLNMIGTAVSHPTRPRPSRNNSSSNSVPKSNQSSKSTPPMPSEAPLPPLPVTESNLSANAPPTSRKMNPPVSAYSTSDYHDSLQVPEPSASNRSNSQRVSRPVSPLNGNSTAYHIPSFGLGMGGRFTLSDYYGSSSNGGSVVGPDNEGTSATGRQGQVHEQGQGPPPPPPPTTGGASGPGRGHNMRRSDVSGLSVDPNWLSREERERRGIGRQSNNMDDGYVSPVESNDSGGRRRRDRL